MDLCDHFSVDGQKTLLVTGIEDIYTDEEVKQVFSVNGNISRVVRISDEENGVRGRVLIEYSTDSAITKIDPIVLGKIPSPNDPNVAWHVRTVRGIYEEEVGRRLAKRYLDELEAVAGNSRAGFLKALQDELQGSRGTEYTSPTTSNAPSVTATPMSVPHVSSAPSPSFQASSVPIDEGIVNPPHLQKVIVEHVIRSESAPLHSSSHPRLRTFSGRIPRPNGEVDYETWRTQVDLLISDPYLTNNQKVRKILESLLTPATDVVKPLGIDSLPSAYVAQLESAFGVVEDGEDLFAAFLNCSQNNGEKPSVYLTRLHTLLTKAISRGGASLNDASKLLLRQFCRGCWDQSLITSLQLELKKDHPPFFPDLLLMLRTEEDRRSAKYDRMKKHLGSTRAAVHAHSILGMPAHDADPVVTHNYNQSVNLKPAKQPNKLNRDKNQEDTTELKRQIEALTKQVERLSHQTQNAREDCNIETSGCLAASTTFQRTFVPSGMPRAWFCFKCGGDGHI
uniref:RRM domain-containing protein n=1 Tax=Oryzias latipes TaxID=8090 RepID=A0A3P9MH87_ORYLA